MTGGRRGRRISVMSDDSHSDPHGERRLRLVLDEHERERSELAHELHEQIAQGLAVVLLGLDAIPPSADTSSRIASVRAHVAEALEHCRALAVALRPPLLDQLGLVPAVERLAERAGVESVKVDRALAGAALGPALRTDVYRSVESALGTVDGANCSLAVSLDRAHREVCISVHAAGPEAKIDALEALAMRLDLIGGAVTTSGSELAIRIPIEPGARAGIAAFPQPGRVEIPDGTRRALP
jgi:signal transduction histidine kinase